MYSLPAIRSHYFLCLCTKFPRRKRKRILNKIFFTKKLLLSNAQRVGAITIYFNKWLLNSHMNSTPTLFHIFVLIFFDGFVERFVGIEEKLLLASPKFRNHGFHVLPLFRQRPVHVYFCFISYHPFVGLTEYDL